VLLEIPHAGRLEALGVDEEAGRLWAYSENTLSAYDFSGRRLSATPIAILGRRTTMTKVVNQVGLLSVPRMARSGSAAVDIFTRAALGRHPKTPHRL